MKQCAAVLVCLVALAFAGCTKQDARGERAAGTLVFAVQKEPISLNPLLLEGIDAYTYSEILFANLTKYDADGRSVPDLATAVPTLANGGVATDGKRVTYHLRRGVRWQDGAPLTAQDVVFTYRAIMNPANNLPERYGYDLVSSVEAPDAYTVVVRLKRAFSPIISFFFGGDSNYPVLPAHLLAALPNINTAAFNAAPIGEGPYRFVRWDRGDRLTFDASPSYFAGKPHIEHLVLPFISQDTTAINELQTGEIDAAMELDPSRIAELRAIPNHRVVVTPVPWYYALGFNLEDPVLSDHAVRESITLAIDRRTLTRKITQGVYDADTAMRGLFTWAFDLHADTIAYDPKRAAALLASAAWVPGPDGIRVKNGKRLHFELAFATGLSITTHFATAIAAEERAIGVDVTLRQYPRTQLISNEGPLMQGRYQLSLYDYQAQVDPDVSWLLECDQRSPHGFNLSRYCNQTVDALLAHAAASFDRATRITDYRAIARQIVNDLPYYFICQVSEVDVIPMSLKGYQRPMLSPFNSVASWR